MKNNTVKDWLFRPLLVTVAGGIIVGLALFSVQRYFTNSAPKINSEIISRVHTETGLGWAVFNLGISIREAEYHSGRLQLIYNNDMEPTCSANLKFNGTYLDLRFSVAEERDCVTNGEAPLQMIIADFGSTEKRLKKEKLVEDLRMKIPSLRYVPSKHAPELSLARNEDPFFSIGESSDLRILLKPKLESIYLGYFWAFH